jgi:hypothetical protein
MNDSYIHDLFDDKEDQHYHDVDDFVDLMIDEIDVDPMNKLFHLQIEILFVLMEMFRVEVVVVEVQVIF